MKEYSKLVDLLVKYLKEGTNQKDDAPDMLAGASSYLRRTLDVFR